MATYKITYTETSVLEQYIEADSGYEALEIWEEDVNDGIVDFSHMDIAESKTTCERVDGE